MIRVQDIKASLDTTPEAWPALVASRLRIPPARITGLTLVKKSVDARDKNDVRFVLTFDVQLRDEAPLLKKHITGVSPSPKKPLPQLAKAAFAQRPVVVGAGPSGLFAALILARQGARPILLERGGCVSDRVVSVAAMRDSGVLDPESNVQFGEGGAGTFSDGKLTTGIKSPWQHFVLETFVAHGAPEDILYEQKPHIGTDLLRGVVMSMREEIIRLGGEVRFNTRMDRLLLKGSRVCGLCYTAPDGPGELLTDTVLLAIGHSARDTVQQLFRDGVVMQQKPFAMGVRIEHPQALINRSQYGRFGTHPALGAAAYKLNVRTPDGRGAYTFCMCPGGEVMAAASQPGGLAVNGMSYRARDGVNANAALLIGVNPADFGDDNPMSGFVLQRSIETAAYRAGGGNFIAPAQRVEDFLAGRASTRFGDVQPSYRPGVVPADLHAVLPKFITENMKIGIMEMDRQLHGFALPDAVMTGVETRSSSPVRMHRGADFMADTFDGLFPVGEGAGYAGGIVSAAVDGINAAAAALERSSLI